MLTTDDALWAAGVLLFAALFIATGVIVIDWVLDKWIAHEERKKRETNE